MGKFENELKRSLRELGISQIDLSKRAGENIVSKAVLSSFLTKGVLPRNLKIIDAIAKALEKDKSEVRGWVAFDVMNRTAETYGINIADLCIPKKNSVSGLKAGKRIPYFENTEHLAKSINKSGYIIHTPSTYIETITSESHLFALQISGKDKSLWPRVQPDEIVFFDPGYKNRSNELYGIIKINNQIKSGRIIRTQNHTIIETPAPTYTVEQFKNKEVSFILSIIRISDKHYCRIIKAF